MLVSTPPWYNLSYSVDPMVKIHGRWCGPNWTGGRKLSAAQYAKRGYDWNSSCSDQLDCACRDHDRSCSGPKGCSKAADTRLIRAARARVLPTVKVIKMNAEILNPFLSWAKREKLQLRLRESQKADLVADAITLARLTRRH